MTKRIFGDIQGYPEGTYFEARLEASRAGVHRPTQGGISGSAAEGADSIEVRGFKWPRRSTTVAVAHLLGEDAFGHWLGVTKGSRWWAADRSMSGVFKTSFVKVVPNGTFWTACFNPIDPVVDVDIVLPVQWVDGALEEIDLELDVVRYVNGSVYVRDQGEFDRVRAIMPDDIATQAEKECKRLRELVERGVEPFGDVGRAWLSRFLTEVDTPDL